MLKTLKNTTTTKASKQDTQKNHLLRFSGREENDRKNYFMVNLHESMGPGRNRTRDPWICSQLRYRRYRLRYAARFFL